MACERMAAVDPAVAGRDELRAAIVDANVSIAARSVAEPRLLGMGTTLTGVLIRDGVAFVGHVGDSRAYLLHEDSLRQVTDDHSWVGEMVRRGELTPAEAAIHPHRSVITKALGTEGDATPTSSNCPRPATGSCAATASAASPTPPSKSCCDVSRSGVVRFAGGRRPERRRRDNVTVVVIDALDDVVPGSGGRKPVAVSGAARRRRSTWRGPQGAGSPAGP
jgi:protein phosphatase